MPRTSDRCRSRKMVRREVHDGYNCRGQAYPATNSISLRDSEYGARRTPRSVMIAVTYLAGVTSKAGLQMPTPCGVSCLPP